MITCNSKPAGRLAEFGSALLCSSTAVFILAAGTLAASTWLGFGWRRAPTISVSGCVVAADGSQVLAMCWMMPPNSTGMRHALASIDLRWQPPRVEAAPVMFSPPTTADACADNAWVVESRIRACQFHDGAPQALPLLAGLVTASRDGLLMFGDDELRAIDLKTRQVSWVRSDLKASCLTFTRRGSLICGLEGRELVEISPDSGEVLRTIRKFAETVLAVAVDPHDALLACLLESGRIEMRLLRDGRLLWSHAGHRSLALPPALRGQAVTNVLCFSPDGYDLVTAGVEQDWILAVWDARTGERWQTLRGHDAQVNGATYLPDGTLLTWSGDGTLRLWDIPRGFARRVISVREIFPC